MDNQLLAGRFDGVVFDLGGNVHDLGELAA